MKDVNFTPASKQQDDFIKSTKRFILFSGAVAAGKSFCGCMKGFLMGYMYPGNRGLICRKEASTIKGSTLQTLLSIIPEELIISFNKSDGVLIHKTRIPGITSTIQFSGLDKKANGEYPTKIGSTEYGWIFVDEITEIDKGDFDMLGTRLRWKIDFLTEEQNDLIPRQMFGATNPDGPHHHLYKFFFVDPELNPSLKKERDVFLGTPYDNRKNLPKGYIEGLEENLTGLFRDRLLLGKWVQAEGVIYKDLDSKNIVPKSTFLDPKFYRSIVAGADSNFPLPRSCVVLGVCGDGHRELFAEFYKKSASVEDLRDWLEALSIKIHKRIIVYHDPSDPQSIDKLSRSKYLTCLKAKNPVVPGISAVSGLITKNQLLIGDHCVHTLKELNSYRWLKGKEGERPVKEDDHLMDALRYAIYSEVAPASYVKGGFLKR